MGNLVRGLRWAFKRSGFDFSPTLPLGKPEQLVRSQEKKKEKILHCETLMGHPPKIEQLGEKVFAYTYSGLELSRKGAKAGSVHMARVDLPSGGKAMLFERLSPKHEPQDAVTLVVDWESETIRYARADGVSSIPKDLKNDSATLSDLLTHGVVEIPLTRRENETTENWRKRWKKATIQKMGQVKSQFQQRGMDGAASVDCGIIRRDADASGRENYHLATVRVGSTVARKKGVMKTGDYGGLEVWREKSKKFTAQRGWGLDFRRNFIGTVGGQSANAYGGRGTFLAEKRLAIVSFTDGLRPIVNGKEQHVMSRVVQVFGGRVNNIVDITELNELLRSGYVNKSDDISLVAISLPGEKKKAEAKPEPEKTIS